jgi:thiazole synthase ThiGH ThiG subunit
LQGFSYLDENNKYKIDFMRNEKLLSRLILTGIGLGVAALIRRGMEYGMQKLQGDEDVDPADPEVPLQKAIMWAVIAGAAAGLAKILAERGTAFGYEKITGHEPPAVN